MRSLRQQVLLLCREVALSLLCWLRLLFVVVIQLVCCLFLIDLLAIVIVLNVENQGCVWQLLRKLTEFVLVRWMIRLGAHSLLTRSFLVLGTCWPCSCVNLLLDESLVREILRISSKFSGRLRLLMIVTSASITWKVLGVLGFYGLACTQNGRVLLLLSA